MIDDPEKLKEERKKYSKWKGRIEGVGGGVSSSSYSSSSYGSVGGGSYGATSSEYYSSKPKNNKKEESSDSEEEEEEKENKKRDRINNKGRKNEKDDEEEEESSEEEEEEKKDKINTKKPVKNQQSKTSGIKIRMMDLILEMCHKQKYEFERNNMNKEVKQYEKIIKQAKKYRDDLNELINIDFEKPSEKLINLSRKEGFDLKDKNIQKYFYDLKMKLIKEINEFHDNNLNMMKGKKKVTKEKMKKVVIIQ